jgi:hypothetical protein
MLDVLGQSLEAQPGMLEVFRCLLGILGNMLWGLEFLVRYLGVCSRR